MKTQSLKTVTPRSLIKAALPIGAFYLTEMLVSLTDLAVVGALGTIELAAVGLGKTILLSVMVVGFAVISIGTVLMAERPNPMRCGAVVTASVTLIPPFVVGAVSAAEVSSSILRASGYDIDLVRAFESYAGILAWAIAPALLFAALKNLLNAIERTAIITLLSMGIVSGNLVVSIVLVHGVGTWQGFGVAGAALATLAVNAVSAAILLGLVLRSRYIHLRTVRLKVISRFVADIVRLGWAAGAQQALESVLFVVVLYVLGLYSPVWLAAGTVVFAVMEINYAASGALGEVMAARVAAQRSEGRAVIRHLLRLGGGVTVVFSALLGLLAGGFGEVTAALFSSSGTTDATRRLIVELLRWTAPFFVFDGLQIVYIHALRGLRETVAPMALSTSCYWLLGLGGGAILAAPAGLGASGIWAGFCIGLASAAMLLATMAFRAARKLT